MKYILEVTRFNAKGANESWFYAGRFKGENGTSFTRDETQAKCFNHKNLKRRIWHLKNVIFRGHDNIYVEAKPPKQKEEK